MIEKKSRLRKKKSICVGHIDNDGCYHMLMGSPSFKGVHNFFSRVLSYPKRFNKIKNKKKIVKVNDKMQKKLRNT